MTFQRANWPDVDDLVALSADTEAMRLWDSRALMTAARVLAVEMPRLMADAGRIDQLGCWVARRRSTGSFLGWFTLTPVSDSARTVALAYRLRHVAGSKSYAVEGTLHLVDVARNAQMATVVARSSADDVDCRDIMEAVGMSPATDLAPGLESDPIEYRLDLLAGEGTR